MKPVKQIGIWMDHSSAHLMECTDPIITRTLESESTHEEREKTLQKGESMMHNREQQQQKEYYKKLGEAIRGYEDVLLFGPTDAKVELLNILKEDRHFENIRIVTQDAGQMTENQEHALVKQYFSKR